jgi:hypothetical protein
MEAVKMARFPKREAEVAALARRLVIGLSGSEDFPNPPVPVDELQAALDEYNAAKDATVTAEAAAQETYAEKDDALEDLTDAVRKNAEKLSRIGWAARKDKTPLEVPGQVRSLEVLQQGEGWLVLDWKHPIDGGRVSAYRVRCREFESGGWHDVAMAIDTEVLLNDQKSGVEIAYEVVAVNKAGTGEPSNIVTVTL